MATPDFIQEPGSPATAPSPEISLESIQQKMENAFKAGNYAEVARLSAITKEISNRLMRDLQTDTRYQRVQRSPESASEEDRKYAQDLTNKIGLARRMNQVTQYAQRLEAQGAPVEDPGLSVGEQVGKRGGAFLASAADRARRGNPTLNPQLKASQEAALGAKRSLQGQAGAASRAANKAKAQAKSATARLGPASKAVEKAALNPAINPTPGTPGTDTKTAATKALRTAKAEQAAAKGAAGAAQRTASRAATDAAAKKALAKSFSSVAARSAPSLFGAMAAAELELLLAPVLAFYQTASEIGDFFSRLEYASETLGRPLGVNDLSTKDLEALGASPGILSRAYANNAIDKEAFFFADPEGAVESGVVSEDEVQTAPGSGPVITPVDTVDTSEAEYETLQSELAQKPASPRIGEEVSNIGEGRGDLRTLELPADSKFDPSLLRPVSNIGGLEFDEGAYMLRRGGDPDKKEDWVSHGYGGLEANKGDPKIGTKSTPEARKDAVAKAMAPKRIPAPEGAIREFEGDGGWAYAVMPNKDIKIIGAPAGHRPGMLLKAGSDRFWKPIAEKFGIDETPEVSMADVDISESDGRETLTEYEPISGNKRKSSLDIGHIPDEVGI